MGQHSRLLAAPKLFRVPPRFSLKVYLCHSICSGVEFEVCIFRIEFFVEDDVGSCKNSASGDEHSAASVTPPVHVQESESND